MKWYFRIGAILCALLIVACQKQRSDSENDTQSSDSENDTQSSDENPAAWYKEIQTADTLSIVNITPELFDSPYITEDSEYGFCLHSGKQTWDYQFTFEAPFFPEQSYSYHASATPIQGLKHPWRIRTGEEVVWKDLHYQNEIEEFLFGECETVVMVHIALDPSSPCNKALLSDVLLTLYRVGGMPSLDLYETGLLEVDHEGIDVPIPIHSFYRPVNDGFVNEDGQLCFSRIVSFRAEVDVPDEDRTEELLLESLNFDISVHFNRTEFSLSMVYLHPDITSVDLLPGVSFEMPDFFTSTNHELVFVNPIMRFAYTCDETANNSFQLNSVLLLDNNPFEMSFYNSCEQLLGPDLTMSYYHSTVRNRVLNDYFQTPFPKEYVFPSMSVKLNSIGNPLLSPKTYSFNVETEWYLPFVFNGKFGGETYQSSILYLNSEELKVPADRALTIKRVFSSTLPFSCIVTPVFQEEGAEPIRLGTFSVDSTGSFSFDYTPTSDNWKASLYFLITPVSGRAVPLKSDAKLWGGPLYVIASQSQVSQ